MSFVTLAFFDTFDLAGSLRPRMGEFKLPAQGLRIFPVRDQEGEAGFQWASVMRGKAKWPEMANLLGRIKREAERRLGGGAEFGHIHLEMLDRGATLPWYAEPAGEPYFQQYARMHIAIRTNPQAMVFCGTQAMHMAPGFATTFNPTLPCTAINLGETARIHLVVDVRKEDVAE